MNKKILPLIFISFSFCSVFAGVSYDGRSHMMGDDAGEHKGMMFATSSMNFIKPVFVGNIRQIQGTVLTLLGNPFTGEDVSTPAKMNARTLYTVETKSAIIRQGSYATSSLSQMGMGDIVSVEGVIQGTNIIATKISFFALPRGMHMNGGMMQTQQNTAIPTSRNVSSMMSSLTVQHSVPEGIFSRVRARFLGFFGFGN